MRFKILIVKWIRPETRRSSYEQADLILINIEGRTGVCFIKLGWLVAAVKDYADLVIAGFRENYLSSVSINKIIMVKHY